MLTALLDRRKLMTSRLWNVVFLIAVSIVVLWWRRPDQFTHPALWVEEGSFILRPYAERGWGSLFEPIAGYIVLLPKLLAFPVYKMWLVNAPLIEMGLAVAVTCLVIVSIWLAPTSLPWKKACALVPLLIPTNSEVFGILSYTFWWAGIWILLALLWRADARQLALRLSMLVMGGLSSPIILSLFPLFGYRAYKEQNRNAWITAGVAFLIAAIQAISLFSTNAITEKIDISIPIFVGKYFGLLLDWDMSNKLRDVLGWVVLGGILTVIFRQRKYVDLPFIILGISFILICAAIMVRVPIGLTHPDWAGPRYYFYPYIILGWMLLWIASLAGRVERTVIVIFLLYCVTQAAPRFPRYHDAIDWPGELQKCAGQQTYRFPFHYTGGEEEIWRFDFTGANCRKLINESVF